MITNGISFTYYLQKINKFVHCSNPEYAYYYFKNYRINLITGKREAIGINNLISVFSNIKVSHYFENHEIYILFYELGFLFNNLDLDENTPLAFAMKFREHNLISPRPCDVSIKFENQKFVEFKDYQSKFDKIQNFLRDGHCYQVNLTERVYWTNENSSNEFYQKFISLSDYLSAYAHFINLPSIEMSFFSNSPECLFQIKKHDNQYEIYSMPIKGTLKRDGVEEDKKWQELKKSEKNQSELFMIIDLIRNDLSRIDRPLTKVIAKKKKLLVPNLIHQYGLISCEISKTTSLAKIISSLFPGGSITGAPKQRVMSIIKEVETSPRQFYCGSTIICFKNNISASINIRSLAKDHKKDLAVYGSGGGVTNLSEKYDEYNEILQKIASFSSIF